MGMSLLCLAYLHYFMSWDCTLSTRFLLDEDATFHVRPRRDWFGTFSNGRLGCVQLADGSAYDIEGVGDICMFLPSGALLTLRYVRYVPGLNQSVILVSQLQSSGHRVLLGEWSFQMHWGSLVMARGARSGLVYPLHISDTRDDVVSVYLQPCMERETRHVSFADVLQYAQIPFEHGVPDVHLSCGDIHANSVVSGDAQLDQSSDEVTVDEP